MKPTVSEKLFKIFCLVFMITSSGVCMSVIKEAQDKRLATQGRNDTAAVKIVHYVDSIEAANKALKRENTGYSLFFNQLKDECDTSTASCCKACVRLRINDLQEIK